MKKMLCLVRAYRAFDPAAKSSLEVVLCYPGFKAICMHRVAHKLYQNRWYFFARVVAEFSRWITGIEIHPGAKLGKDVIIEHGMGVVIGETAIVHDRVVILQCVTLGSRHVNRPESGRRHPEVESGAILCAGSKVLGAVTIGRGAIVGANSVVLCDVPPSCTVAGCPAKVISMRNDRLSAVA